MNMGEILKWGVIAVVALIAWRWLSGSLLGGSMVNNSTAYGADPIYAGYPNGYVQMYGGMIDHARGRGRGGWSGRARY
jgi:hypothetical protein